MYSDACFMTLDARLLPLTTLLSKLRGREVKVLAHAQSKHATFTQVPDSLLQVAATQIRP